jgi:hypothetical protein
MILEIIVGGAIVLFEILTLYVIYNLYNKVDNLEQWIDSTYVMIQDTLQEMRNIDSSGHFESDDETGIIFKELEETLNKLETITEEQPHAA